MKTFQEWLSEIIPILSKRIATRVDQELKDGSASAYWVGNTIRIDYKPKG